jgi:hypothetical protein
MMFMIGLALTGAKLAGNLLGSLLAKKAAQSNQPVSGNVQAENVTLGPGAVASAPKSDVLSNVIQSASNLVGPLIQKAGAPAISGVGGILKSALSTLNDDEWFEAYDGNGATFNELLTTYSKQSSSNSKYCLGVKAYGAMAGYGVGARTEGAYYNQFMPHILAYIRSKTNNILQDNVDTYQRVFCNVVTLYEIFYDLKKWDKFMLNTPSNCPTVINVVNAFRPENVNITRGIIDNLESYLKATVKLPYALASYIRWRFGTMFLSTNTKRAGFITYDPCLMVATAVDATTRNVTFNPTADTARSLIPKNGLGAASPAQITTQIEAIKTQLVIDGRALSDFAMAYADHEIKYDVEDRHFDEKEFCLRQNIARYEQAYNFGAGKKSTGLDDGSVEVYMDSRIDMNAGIQAITISLDNAPGQITISGSGLAPFPITSCTLFLDNAGLPSAIANAITNAKWTNAYGSWMYYDKTFAGYANEHILNKATLSSNSGTTYGELLAQAVSISLELHGANSFDVMTEDGTDASTTPAMIVQFGTLSYDRAKISVESLAAIQRNAILNLVRGDYKRKRQLDVKEDATTVVDGLTSKDVTFTDKKIDVK